MSLLFDSFVTNFTNPSVQGWGGFHKADNFTEFRNIRSAGAYSMRDFHTRVSEFWGLKLRAAFPPNFQRTLAAKQYVACENVWKMQDWYGLSLSPCGVWWAGTWPPPRSGRGAKMWCFSSFCSARFWTVELCQRLRFAMKAFLYVWQWFWHRWTGKLMVVCARSTLSLSRCGVNRECWSYIAIKFVVLPLEEDTIDRSGLNLARKRLPCIYCEMPNLAMIGERGWCRRPPKIQQSVKNCSFSPHRCDSIHWLRWNLAWYNNVNYMGHGSTIADKFRPDRQMGWVQEPHKVENFVTEVFCPQGGNIKK